MVRRHLLDHRPLGLVVHGHGQHRAVRLLLQGPVGYPMPAAEELDGRVHLKHHVALHKMMRVGRELPRRYGKIAARQVPHES